MMREQRTAFILLLILFFGVFLSSHNGAAKAETITSIYIEADGRVEGTEKIQKNESIYTLTGNVYNSLIYVLKDGIVLNGAGYTLQGPSSGVVLRDSNNVTVKNFVISNEEYVGDSIYVYYCSNCTIINNKIELNRGTGISVWGGSSNVIAGNLIMNNTCGIHLGENTSNNSIFGNNITDNICSMQIYGTQNNSIYYNNFINNEHISITPISPRTTQVIHFDNGTTGNHWNNYKGTDPDGDGIGNTPYIINEHNRDDYPLMERVQIIPELPSWIVLPMFITVTICALSFKKKLSHS